MMKVLLLSITFTILSNSSFTAIYHKNYLWGNKGVLYVCFTHNSNPLLNAEIVQIANKWLVNTQLKFMVSSQPNCHIKIQLDSNEFRSEIGTASLYFVSHSPTMFLKINSDQSTLSINEKKLILHEFGHALGFEHEHFHPILQTKFKNEHILNQCSQIYKKSISQCERDLIFDLSSYPVHIDNQPDYHSIMMYNFSQLDKSLLLNKDNTEPSERDLEAIQQMYPPSL